MSRLRQLRRSSDRGDVDEQLRDGLYVWVVDFRQRIVCVGGGIATAASCDVRTLPVTIVQGESRFSERKSMLTERGGVLDYSVASEIPSLSQIPAEFYGVIRIVPAAQGDIAQHEIFAFSGIAVSIRRLISHIHV